MLYYECHLKSGTKSPSISDSYSGKMRKALPLGYTNCKRWAWINYKFKVSDIHNIRLLSSLHRYPLRHYISFRGSPIYGEIREIPSAVQCREGARGSREGDYLFNVNRLPPTRRVRGLAHTG